MGSGKGDCSKTGYSTRLEQNELLYGSRAEAFTRGDVIIGYACSEWTRNHESTADAVFFEQLNWHQHELD